MFKKRRGDNHSIFKNMISFHRRNNPTFDNMINQIVTPSDKSIARRAAAMERKRAREEMVQEAMIMAVDAEKNAAEARERAKWNLDVEKNVSYISYEFVFYLYCLI